MSGPCSPWPIEPSAECCPTWAALPDAQKERAINYATMVMWAATGRRYGPCENVVRPCGNDRKCATEGGYYFYNGWMRPYILDGTWRNCACNGGCDCRPDCQVKLAGPVASVTEVMVDGIVIAPSSWRVDDNQWLVRTDGECWPRCQDYNVDVPEEGTFQVTYLRGDPIPVSVLDAAATLACEFAKSCSGQACRLPSRMQALTRQGVSVSFMDVDMLLKRGLTGIVEIDQVIMADNPYARKERAWLYSYDTAPRARTVTQA